MGGKETKPISLTYEDALKRVSDAELQRIKDAYKHTVALNSAISKQAFDREVLGDGVPLQLADLIFTACGGTSKGITFKDLFCSLVLLTRGKDEEKIKFIFGLYANESGNHIIRTEMLRQLQATEGDFTPETVKKLFHNSEKVTYDEFRDWLLSHSNATTITRWLLDEHSSVSLSNDLETPTFYQTLAGVTHLEESEILELEKQYWILKGLSPIGKLDPDTLVPMMSPPLPKLLARGVFDAFDENRDNHIDFKEMACGISAACRGPLTERQKFCFKIFDRDRDGKLSKEELTFMVQSLLMLKDEEEDHEESLLGTNYSIFNDVCVGISIKEVQLVVEELLNNHDPSNSGFITQEEFLIWTLNNTLTTIFTEIIFQVCHVVLGLRPNSLQEERDIVLGWLRRAEKKSMVVGQFWYIINMEWWNMWLDYVTFSALNDGSSTLNSSKNCSPTSSLTGTLKRNKFNKGVEGSVAMDNSGIMVTSIANLPANEQGNSLQCIPELSSPTRHNSYTNLNAFSKTLSSNSLSVVNHDRSRGSSPSHSPCMQRRTGFNGYSHHLRPSAIDNYPLLEPLVTKVAQLTSEGGRLKRNIPLAQGRDFVLVPESLWKVLHHWYGGAPAIPRQVIHGRCSGEVELELYPLTLKILRHAQSPTRSNYNYSYNNNNWVGLVGSYGAAALNSSQYYVPAFVTGNSSPKRNLSYLAAFSRLANIKQVYEYLGTKLRIKLEDMRLWHVRDEPAGMTLLEEETSTLEDTGLSDLSQILLEVRNKDLTWPEEMSQISRSSSSYTFKSHGASQKGITGLSNLGNTCFLNAALQCCSNTEPLTTYFIRNMHLYEMNFNNPCGMKGFMARHYGTLIHELWGGVTKTVAPLKLRWTIGKYSGNFTGFQQHDSQELLAFLLDGLHEDLNRVHNKPYTELKDSEGRPDIVVAQEAWENHILRNKSIIVDLFHGQLKSKVTCRLCSNESVRFDPFSYLTLPMPMESYLYIEVVVLKLDGSTPYKYGLRLVSDSRYRDIKWHLSALTGITPAQFMLTELQNAQIKCVHSDESRIRNIPGILLYAYELPSPTSSHATESKTVCSSAKNRQLFQHIQRSTHHSSPCLRTSAAPPNPQKIPEGNNLECLNTHESTSLTENVSPCPSSTIRCQEDLERPHKGFIVAFHRKMTRQEVYFLSSQKTKPSLFGLPVIIPCSSSTSHQDLYRMIWTQVSRLVSPLPPSETSGPNHAHDCDDSLGYEFPFILRKVERFGIHCAQCPWHRFCRGCKISCDEETFVLNASFLAIDWDPTALHLRYQSSLEKIYKVHNSVEEMQKRHTEPISLGDCLEAFCSEETLEYSCEKCKSMQKASKKLQIWRLPPILIVHLKRFQFVANKWIKSQKIVEFPLKNLDPTDYLASVPRQTILLHRAELEGVDPATYVATLQDKDNVFLEIVPENKMVDTGRNNVSKSATPKSTKNIPNGNIPSSSLPGENQDNILDKRRRVRNGSVLYGESLQDFHQHRLEEGNDPLDLKYNLYAIACHTGIMEGGHYVCYAKNSLGKWICFNDSSCKEVPESQVDLNSAYMLFYQREGISVEQYMPNVQGRSPVSQEAEEDVDDDEKRQCNMM